MVFLWSIQYLVTTLILNFENRTQRGRSSTFWCISSIVEGNEFFEHVLDFWFTKDDIPEVKIDLSIWMFLTSTHNFFKYGSKVLGKGKFVSLMNLYGVNFLCKQNATSTHLGIYIQIGTSLSLSRNSYKIINNTLCFKLMCL